MKVETKDLMGLVDQRPFAALGYAEKLTGGHSPYGISFQFGESTIDENEMSVHFPYADGNRRDGVGDLLEVTGIDLSRHRTNPCVLFDHGKVVTIPIAKAEDPKTKEYTVTIDPVAKQAWCKAFFYQGTDNDHARFCEQTFDLVAKKYIRGASIGYVTKKGYPLAADPHKGTPQGMHLLEILQLEVSIVIMPANPDTTLKMLSMRRVCGAPMSPVLVKSLMSCGAQRKAQLFVEGKRHGDIGHLPEGHPDFRRGASRTTIQAPRSKKPGYPGDYLGLTPEEAGETEIDYEAEHRRRQENDKWNDDLAGGLDLMDYEDDKSADEPVRQRRHQPGDKVTIETVEGRMGGRVRRQRTDQDNYVVDVEGVGTWHQIPSHRMSAPIHPEEKAALDAFPMAPNPIPLRGGPGKVPSVLHGPWEHRHGDTVNYHHEASGARRSGKIVGFSDDGATTHVRSAPLGGDGEPDLSAEHVLVRVPTHHLRTNLSQLVERDDEAHGDVERNTPTNLDMDAVPDPGRTSGAPPFVAPADVPTLHTGLPKRKSLSQLRAEYGVKVNPCTYHCQDHDEVDESPYVESPQTYSDWAPHPQYQQELDDEPINLDSVSEISEIEEKANDEYQKRPETRPVPQVTVSEAQDKYAEQQRRLAEARAKVTGGKAYQKPIRPGQRRTVTHDEGDGTSRDEGMKQKSGPNRHDRRVEHAVGFQRNQGSEDPEGDTARELSQQYRHYKESYEEIGNNQGDYSEWARSAEKEAAALDRAMKKRGQRKSLSRLRTEYGAKTNPCPYHRGNPPGCDSVSPSDLYDHDTTLNTLLPPDWSALMEDDPVIADNYHPDNEHKSLGEGGFHPDVLHMAHAVAQGHGEIPEEEMRNLIQGYPTSESDHVSDDSAHGAFMDALKEHGHDDLVAHAEEHGVPEAAHEVHRRHITPKLKVGTKIDVVHRPTGAVDTRGARVVTEPKNGRVGYGRGGSFEGSTPISNRYWMVVPHEEGDKS